MLTEIKSRYRQQQTKATVRVNQAALEFNWSMGVISFRKSRHKMGRRFFQSAQSLFA